MIKEYTAPTMPTQTLEALERVVHVCKGIDEHLEMMEEWFVNEDLGYDDYDDNTPEFDLNDAGCYGAFTDYIKSLNTGVLKCGGNVYWITEDDS